MVDQDELRQLIADVYRENEGQDAIEVFRLAVRAVRKRYGVNPSTARGWVQNNRPRSDA